MLMIVLMLLLFCGVMVVVVVVVDAGVSSRLFLEKRGGIIIKGRRFPFQIVCLYLSVASTSK
jgi:hypothetical protein